MKVLPPWTLVSKRLQGDMAAFDIMAGKTLIVERGRRITARHIRELENAGIEMLSGARGISCRPRLGEKCHRYELPVR